MATKQYSYHNHPILYKLTILGQDATQHLSEPRSVSTSLDYPTLQQFRVAEMTLVMKNPNNLFSPYNASNFFVTHGATVNPPIQADGYRATVRLQAGYMVNGVERLQDIYVGQVNDIQINASDSTVNLVCLDESKNIEEQDITDFGALEKKMTVEPAGSGLHGNYPFYSGLLPYSAESVESPGLTRRQYLNTEGPLDNSNFLEDPESGIMTEGGQRSTDPVVQFKAPYRNRKIADIIPLLLSKYGIMSSEINLPIASGDRYWSNLGKPYYEPIFSDLTVTRPGTFQWPGVITDMIGDATNDVIYMLVSQTGHPIRRPLPGNQDNTTPQPKPRILKWNLRNDTREEVIVISESGADVSEECWRMVADSTFNTFYVLGCQPVYIGAATGSRSNRVIPGGYQFGSYSSFTPLADNSSTVRVHRINNVQSSPGRSTYFNPRNSGIASFLPQLACYYHLGNQGATVFELRKGEIPDSRRAFHLRNNGHLVYAFATREDFGVARSTSANSATRVISAKADKSFNASSFAFAVDESAGHVYFAYSQINKDGNSSRAKIVRGDI